MGAHYRTFYTPEDQAAGEPERNLARAAREGRVEAEGWRVRKDGSRFRAHVIIDRIQDDQGRLVGFAKVTRDVTEQHLAERALEEARIALFQAQKMESIGQLTGGMAHDFNNLLVAIQSALDLLGPRLPTDERTRGIYSAALAGVQRGASLTQRMLAFARRQELQPCAVNVPQLVHGMSRLIDRTLGDRYQLVTRFEPALSLALVDPHQLELALLNLVVNARDAYADGGGLIVIEASMKEPPPVATPEPDVRRFVCLSVIDQGQGMDVDTLARSTDPFFTTKGVGKGTGLGLSMVHGLAAQSQGRLVLESRPGAGTRVDLWLPVAEETDTGLATDLAPGQTTQVEGKRALRILTVDDDVLVLMTLEALLEDLGHEVTAVSSAREAIEALAGDATYDVLMTDYAMPGQSGVELAQEAKRLRPRLPVVLATGYAEVSLKDFPELFRLGKPFDRSRLAEVLEQATSAG
ncbi:ATP-binding protein [Luteibacter sp. PPL201]|uniref:histidine kinase n=1 Tax=Luteibacter sahnii TaxID=3021977 RepID=A0ABT6BBR5_9GAMM